MSRALDRFDIVAEREGKAIARLRGLTMRSTDQDRRRVRSLDMRPLRHQVGQGVRPLTDPHPGRALAAG